MQQAETELKLAVTPRTLAKLAQDPVFGAAAGEACRLDAVYFDDRRRTLWRGGVSLRLRHEGGHWLQTVKAGGTVAAGVHRRLEVSRRAAGASFDPGLLGEEEAEQFVARAARRSPLAPQFRIEFERDARLLAVSPELEIEVSFDRGAILAGGKRARISEVELELKRGSELGLFELAQSILARYPARIETRSKAERGFELIGAVRPRPVRGRFDAIRLGMSVAEAFRASCLACLDHFQANLPGVVRGGDPEYVHQARVALRRLHALLEAFAPLLAQVESRQRIRATRALARSLGPARDWDVFAAQTLAPILEQFPGHRGIHALDRACGRLRAKAYRRARRAVAARRTQRLLLDFGAWLQSQPWLAAGDTEAQRAWQQPVREYAMAVLDRYHRRALKRGRGIGSASLARLHRLRIAAKKLRYAAGFFAALFPARRAAPLAAALSALQDALGEINDCATAPSMIDALHRISRDRLRVQAQLIVSHWNEALLARRRARLKPVWKAVRRCEPFWR